MKKYTIFILVFFVMIMTFVGCQKKDNVSQEENDAKSDDLQTKQTATPMPETSSEEYSIEDYSDVNSDALKSLLEKGQQNQNKHNSLSYYTSFVDNDGNNMESFTKINLETAESYVESLYVDKDDKLTQIYMYNTLDGVYIHIPSEGMSIKIPTSASDDNGMNIPLVPIVPVKPLTAFDITNGLGLLNYAGYEKSDTTDYVLYTHNDIGGNTHKIWLDRKTGLLEKQEIITEDGTIEFYSYTYFTADEDAFALPDGVEFIDFEMPDMG